MTPPVQQSPQPKDEVSDTPTGRWKVMSEELDQKFKGEKIWTAAVAALALVVSLLAVLGGYRLFLGDARAQTKEQVDAGLDAVKHEIKAIKDEQTVTKENQKVVLTAVKDLQEDVREAYKAARYDRSSARLERPPPDRTLLSADGGVLP